jgi:outer membrane protein TolC
MNYKAGISTMTDLLQAEALLLQAENNYTDANITFLTAQRKFNDFNN